MFGLMFYGAVAIYIAAWWLVVRWLKTRWAKAGAIFIALAIPFWEVPIGYVNFQLNCAEHGGLHTIENLQPVDSIFVERETGYTPELLARYGFKVLEYESSGSVLRYTQVESGVTKSLDGSITSQVKIAFSGNRKLDWNLSRRDFTASRIHTGQVIARNTSFRWGGTWWQVELSPLLGDGGRCYEVGGAPVLLAITGGKRS